MHVTGEKVTVALSTDVAYRYWFAKTLLSRGEARYHLPCSDEVMYWSAKALRIHDPRVITGCPVLSLSKHNST
jgi:hypothetical protein